MKKVNCFDCGKSVNIFETDAIQIPKIRCDDCLEDVRKIR